jgi:hypothetical protein
VNQPARPGRDFEFGDQALGGSEPALRVGRHVTGREHVGVGVVVVGVHAHALTLQGVADSRGAREQVERGARTFGLAQDGGDDARHQQSLGADVLDHGDLPVSVCGTRRPRE